MQRCFFVGLLMSLTLSPLLIAQESLENQFATTLKHAVEMNFSGIVIAEKDGEIVASKSIGFADSESELQIDNKTLFEIGSVTKPITALAVVILDQKGKLSLDDSIADHLPAVPNNCNGITIKHLLQHTSGIPGTNYGPHSTDVALVTKAYLRGGPKAKPGTRFEYWNQGYSLLAAVIAKVTGKSYQDAIKDLIFRPAKMGDSCFTGDEPPKGVPVSIGKSTFGASRSALDHPYGDSYGLHYQGMGGIVTNAKDMVKFVQAMRKSKPSLKTMLQVGPNGVYGVGWQIEELSSTQMRVFHSGSVRGFLASVSFYPTENSSIIVLSNTDDKKAFYFAESNCRKAFEASIIELPDDQQFDATYRESILGSFKLQRRIVTISEVNDGLEMVIDWGGPKTLGKLVQTDSEDKLRYLDGSNEKIFVSLGKKRNGKVQSIKIMNQEYLREK